MPVFRILIAILLFFGSTSVHASRVQRVSPQFSKFMNLMEAMKCEANASRRAALYLEEVQAVLDERFERGDVYEENIRRLYERDAEWMDALEHASSLYEEVLGPLSSSEQIRLGLFVTAIHVGRDLADELDAMYRDGTRMVAHTGIVLSKSPEEMTLGIVEEFERIFSKDCGTNQALDDLKISFDKLDVQMSALESVAELTQNATNS